MRRLLIALALTAGVVASAQTTPKARDFQEACDSLDARLYRRLNITQDYRIKMKKVMKRGTELDLYFTDDLSFYPWTDSDVKWFTQQASAELKNVTASFTLGKIYTKGEELKYWILNPSSLKSTDPRLSAINRFIEQEGAPRFNEGLSDRYVALWQSHGRYFKEADSCWRWQRAPLHRTVEDMFTQSIVLPFLIPMLENAGAYVMTPRERDIQLHEVICDGDRHFNGGAPRTHGRYSEDGAWTSAGTGFADLKALYEPTDNPFEMGTSRKANCRPDGGCEARWTPVIPERGRYAVYVSYKSAGNSCTAARYTVHHLGGETVFKVNQRRGGGMWTYLGTFEFGEGDEGWVSLDNSGPEGAVVSADAVKFGGGYGKVARAGENSGLGAYTEGALYSMPWYGVDSSVFTEKDDDYHRDYFSRGVWVNWLKESKGIPFDVSLALHSDAGVSPNDSIVGTLAIHTLISEGKKEYKGGASRFQGRLMADMIQTQVVDDIRATFEPEWNRRGLWNKTYAESRIPEVPSMLLEMMSHQNLADMKYGEDPAFKFTIARAIYKGILRFTASIYGCRYTVQPLPVRCFSAKLEDGNAVLEWKPREDPLEAGAFPDSYMVYTRIDDGAFDKGIHVDGCSYTRRIKEGHIYSFRVVACNGGGFSFPSETLAVGLSSSGNAPVLVVNNFDRVSAPAWVDIPGFSGFYAAADSGVPYFCDISYIGENFEFDRDREWVTDDDPGFGATNTDKAGLIVAGNSFDYPYVHGSSLMKLGFSFCSMSEEAFEEESPAGGFRALDLICGKQATTRTGSGHMPDRYPTFTPGLMEALQAWGKSGMDIIISGSAIASDRSADPKFCADILGYKKAAANASGSGAMTGKGLSASFYTSPNPVRYCIESPDGLSPASSKSGVVLRYTDAGTPAAVLFKGEGYKVFSIGVPLECLTEDSAREAILKKALE